jgi:predicted nucleotidyltransferase
MAAGENDAMSVDTRLGLIDAVIYADVFDCAVTTEELRRFSRIPIPSGGARRAIEADPALADLVSEGAGLWCLKGREELLAARGRRRERADRLRRRADAVATMIRRVPFVRGLLLTGSTAAADAADDADVDLLVLVTPGRLATTFTALGGLSRLLGRSVLCPNYYLATDALTLDRRDIYVARELAQAVSLSGEAEALVEANAWLAELLPNAGAGNGSTPPRRRPRLQGPMERMLAGRIGDWLERRLRRLALARLGRHYGGAVPAEVATDFASGRQLRFHGVNDARALLTGYERRRGELAARLADSDRRSTRPGKRGSAPASRSASGRPQ